MITAAGIALICFAFISKRFLQGMGLYSVFINHWSDWIVGIPGIAGIGCLVTSACILSARYLP